MLDAADIKLDGAIGARGAAGAVEESEGVVPELFAVVDYALPEEIAAFEILEGKDIAASRGSSLDFLAAAIVKALDEFHQAHLDVCFRGLKKC